MTDISKELEEIRHWRIALAHYWFVTWRGGEKVMRSILDLFPNADIYTLFYESQECGKHLEGHRVFSSSLNRPFLRKHYQKIFPLYPSAVRSLKLDGEYDLLLSSESGPTKGISRPNGTPHLCYIHTPMRYCWGFTADYLAALPPIARPAARLAFERLRQYDCTTIDNVDHYVANSANVQQRVKTYYNRNASVVCPPIALDLFTESNLTTIPCKDREYYLSFGAITPYKNIGLLVDTFNKTGQKLVVIGEGSERIKLQARAKSNILFTGALPYSEIQRYIRGAKALLFPGEEDFGMIPLEVMAHGVPVLAFGKGGALETVVSNAVNPRHSSGLFFESSNVDALIQCIEHFETIQNEFSPQWIQAHARQFGEDHFKDRFAREVIQLLRNRGKL